MLELNLKHVAVYDKYFKMVLLADYVTDYRGVSYYVLKYTDMIRRNDGKRVPGLKSYERSENGTVIPRRVNSPKAIEALAKKIGLVYFEF